MGKGGINMKFVFFGTPDYVVPILDTLHRKFRNRSGESPIAAVVTQAPKPTGRKQLLVYSPVDDWAFKKKITKVFAPEDLIKEHIYADLGILAAYGAIIPQPVISLFKFGVLNIHPSLLPKFRGASPIQATIISGEKETGVTIINIDNELDHGSIISQFKDEVLPDDTTESLRSRLFARSAEVLTTLIPAYIQGKITPREQDHKMATFTHQIKKEEAFIPPDFINSIIKGQIKPKKQWEIPFIKEYKLPLSGILLNDFIRAMQPWPIAWTYVNLDPHIKSKEMKRLKILKAHTEEVSGLKSKTLKHKLVLDIVLLEGKSPVSWKQFLEGYPEAKFEK
jgi:methionyl-tRNA formyltransferase